MSKQIRANNGSPGKAAAHSTSSVTGPEERNGRLPAPSWQAAVHSAASRTISVLIVEDSPLDATMQATRLEGSAYELRWRRVEDAAGMKAALAQQSWDVVLCDHQLPAFDSFQALAMLDASGLDLPLILVSGAIGEEVAVAAIQAGAAEYVSKDHLGRLKTAVHRCLRQAEERRARASAEQALVESEARYRMILETTPDGVWRIDAENRTDYVNPRMADMLGYSPDEMIGRELSDFMDPEDHEIAEREMARARDQGRPRVVESRFVRKDGTHCWTRVSHTALPDRDGNQTGGLAIISDITASKAQAVELHATELFLAALTDSMADGMFALNRAQVITYMNEAAETILGWTQEELATRSMPDAENRQHDHGLPYLTADCRLLGVLETGTTIRVDDDVFVRRDGRLLSVAYSAAPITIDEQVQGVVVVFGDDSVRRGKERRRKRELEMLNWVGRIRDALDEDRLVLHAQPIIALPSRDVVAHELLLRIVGRDGAIIEPGRFLPAAEQYGLIEEIDRWVVARAIQIAAVGLRAHFNISGRSLESHELINDLVRGLHETGADPGLLVCEITETALANDKAVAESFVRELSALGCEIAIDDFGIGYGGFAYLKHLPITVLKIDIDFVRDLVGNPQNQHIVKAIVTLARGFGRKTVAEGVENQATLELLEEFDVDYAQGFVISRPGPIDTMIRDATSALRRVRDAKPRSTKQPGAFESPRPKAVVDPDVAAGERAENGARGDQPHVLGLARRNQ